MHSIELDVKREDVSAAIIRLALNAEQAASNAAVQATHTDDTSTLAKEQSNKPVTVRSSLNYYS